MLFKRGHVDAGEDDTSGKTDVGQNKKRANRLARTRSDTAHVESESGIDMVSERNERRGWCVTRVAKGEVAMWKMRSRWGGICGRLIIGAECECASARSGGRGLPVSAAEETPPVSVFPSAKGISRGVSPTTSPVPACWGEK
jgi:hypothetical protein